MAAMIRKGFAPLAETNRQISALVEKFEALAVRPGPDFDDVSRELKRDGDELLSALAESAAALKRAAELADKWANLLWVMGAGKG